MQTACVLHTALIPGLGVLVVLQPVLLVVMAVLVLMLAVLAMLAMVVVVIVVMVIAECRWQQQHALRINVRCTVCFAVCAVCEAVHRAAVIYTSARRVAR
jgi:hypothetical protein